VTVTVTDAEGKTDSINVTIYNVNITLPQ